MINNFKVYLAVAAGFAIIILGLTYNVGFGGGTFKKTFICAYWYWVFGLILIPIITLLIYNVYYRKKDVTSKVVRSLLTALIIYIPFLSFMPFNLNKLLSSDQGKRISLSHAARNSYSYDYYLNDEDRDAKRNKKSKTVSNVQFHIDVFDFEIPDPDKAFKDATALKRKGFFGWYFLDDIEYEFYDKN